LRYDVDLFEAATIERMAESFRMLLAAALATPNKKLSLFECLTSAERQQLLHDWNDTRQDFDLETCIPQLVEAQVARTSKAIAVCFQDKRLTYGQLNDQANSLASKLQAMGVGKGSYVPVLLNRSLELVVSWFAIMKTGAAFVPLDTGWPLQRLQQVLSDLGSKLLLVNRSTPQQPDELECDFMTVEDHVNSGGKRNPREPADPEQPIYVMYTSGSTGKPKGVVVAHRGITNRFLWMNQFFGLEAARSVLQTTRQVYDSAVWQLFWPLINGGKTVIPSPQMELTAVSLVDLIDEHKVTTTDFVPSVFNVIVPQLVGSESPRTRLQSLRTVIVGGEEVTAATAYQFQQYFPDVRVVNLYGPTEASIGCICYELPTADQAVKRQRIPIGKPIGNARVVILDQYRKLVPPGVKGELYLTGACLGLGYLNDEEQTNSAFVRNPYPELGWKKLYKTGDVGRYLADGNIEFLGRCDHQVKIRGFRIELGEIEFALRQHPQVSECVVVTREDSRAEKRLVAYVVPVQGFAATTNDLRGYLKDRLPGYMVPAVFMKIDAMPLTPGGKLDQRRLPAPEWGIIDEPNEKQIGKRTAIEEIIAGIWAELLGLDWIGVDDDFFALGGHSLLATQVISRLRSVMQLEIPLRNLFEYPTVAGLASSVRDLFREKQKLQSLPPLRSVSRTNELPLSSEQRRLWFLDQLTPGSPAYNIPGAVRLEGALNTSALEQSFSELIRRHESLRTSFGVSHGNPIQIIGQPAPAVVLMYDLTKLRKSARERCLRSLIDQHAAYCFDLSRGSLLHTTLVRLTETEHVLLLTIHHIISDAWSIDILISEITTLYEAFSQGGPSPLADLQIQFADFAVWQQEVMQGEVLEKELAYWRRQLDGVPPLGLPTDRPRPAVLTYRGSQSPLSLGQDLTQRLKSLSQRAGATLFMTLLAAWQALLHRYTDQDDMASGLATANRNDLDTEKLIGFFVNMLVLRTDLSGNPTFMELLDRVREVCLQAYAHQHLPFEKLVEQLKPQRELSRTPFFQVVIQMLNPAKPELQVSGLKITAMEIESGMPHFDLILSFSESQQQLTGVLEYNSELFDETRILRMLDHYQILLAEIAADPNQRLCEIPLESEAPLNTLPANVHREFQDHQFTFEMS
jgi:amino acid adenylation domain-containing protein